MDRPKQNPESKRETKGTAEVTAAPIFTLEERKSVENWFEHFKRTHPEILKAAKDMTDADVIDGLEATLYPIGDMDDKKGTSTLAIAVIKAKKTLNVMQSNLQALASEEVTMGERGTLEKYISKFAQNRAKYPFSIRVQLASLNLAAILKPDESLKDLTHSEEGQKELELLEQFIAALIYQCITNGIKYPHKIDNVENIRKTYVEAIQKIMADFKIIGTVGNMEFIAKIEGHNEELIRKGIIIKKKDTGAA